MDLKSIDTTLATEAQGAVVPIFLPNGKADTASDGSPTTVTIVGQYSPHYREQLRAWQVAQAENPVELSGEVFTTETIVWSVTDWHGFEDGGEPLPCTAENVRMVLSQAPWVRDQLIIAKRDRARFFPAASAS